MAETVRISGLFETGESFAQAVFGLESRGVDRAAITLLAKDGPARESLTAVGARTGGAEPADAVTTTDDAQQVRILFTSLAASVAGLIASGVTVAASGGAIPAVVAGLVAASGFGGAAELIERLVADGFHQLFRAGVDKGHILMTARVASTMAEAAERIMSDAGGRYVHVVKEMPDRAAA